MKIKVFYEDGSEEVFDEVVSVEHAWGDDFSLHIGFMSYTDRESETVHKVKRFDATE